MKSKKIISLILIGGMIFNIFAPVVYAETTNGEVIENYTFDIEDLTSDDGEIPSQDFDSQVYYSSAESLTVIIPKTINLDGTQANPTTSFNVSVSGDISGTSEITVSSDENFYMKQDGKADVLAVVGYQRTFTSAEVVANTTDSGSVSIPSEDENKLSSGAWNGTFKFYINYENEKKNL